LDSVKPKRKGKQPYDLSCLKYTQDQIRLKLQKYCGITRALKSRSPALGFAKSTKISLKEISAISKIDYRNLISFRKNKFKLCRAQLMRLIDAIDLCDSGRVVKTQSGVYTIHDDPQVEPVREMHIDVFGGRILPGVTIVKAPSKMPSFDKLFG
jgi:hypothetical protein